MRAHRSAKRADPGRRCARESVRRKSGIRVERFFPSASAAGTARNSGMPSKRNGSFQSNSKLSGRGVTCGYTARPSAWRLRLRSRTSRCQPGPRSPVNSAVQVIGRPLARASDANCSRKKPGPKAACTTPRPSGRSARASASISPSSAARLGACRPSDDVRRRPQVAKPTAPPPSPARRAQPRDRSLGRGRRSVAASPIT